jgi:uncharacterized membrane protein YccC
MTIITLTTIRTIVSILTEGALFSGHLRLDQVAITAFVAIFTLAVIATDYDEPSRVTVPTATRMTVGTVWALHDVSLPSC